MKMQMDGKDDPARLSNKKRTEAAETIFRKHKGKKTFTKAEMDELFTAILQLLGRADETGTLN